jgi:hypothetical protein
MVKQPYDTTKESDNRWKVYLNGASQWRWV